MAGSLRSGDQGSRGPQLEDCQRLIDTLVTEYVTDLGIRVVFQAAQMPSYRACIQVWSPGLDPETGRERDHIWAIKDLPNGYDIFTYGQLYVLLMDAYRRIQDHIGGQMALPLR